MFKEDNSFLAITGNHSHACVGFPCYIENSVRFHYSTLLM